MHVFEMVVLIVGICVIGGIIKSYLDRNNPKASGDVSERQMNDLAPFMERFEAMEQRLQVLERIATDKGRNLASEIDNLK